MGEGRRSYLRLLSLPLLLTSTLGAPGCTTPKTQGIETSQSLEPTLTSPLSPAEYRAQRLTEAGIPFEFAHNLLKGYDESVAEKVIELNVLGFLGQADYSGHFNRRAVSRCKAFMKRNRLALARAETRFGVKKEVIAALLWVETKHGRHLGSFPVADVYLSLIEAPHPTRLEKTINAAQSKAPTFTPELRGKIIERSNRKASWAIDQLKALERIQSQGLKDVRTLRGSYAGAFGIPQFVPSSYLEWAKPARSGRRPNLFQPSDAILSVASYLNAQGWNGSDPSSFQKALFHYNRAQGYVDVILKLAEAL